MELPHPWYDLIINPPCRTFPQHLTPICNEKLLQKSPSMFFGGRHYALAPMENPARVYALSIFATKCGLKLVNILNLVKRIVWQNRSEGWGIIWDLECCQLKPLRVLHWDLTSSWSSFLSSSLNSNKTTVINTGWLSLSPKQHPKRQSWDSKATTQKIEWKKGIQMPLFINIK